MKEIDNNHFNVYILGYKINDKIEDNVVIIIIMIIGDKIKQII